ncbi:MAG TPA: hypothetical protein ENG62_00565, partial [Thermoplasmatales archaeon]|nr:hypothetical protein [Thermoplasmatales archaeon]
DDADGKTTHVKYQLLYLTDDGKIKIVENLPGNSKGFESGSQPVSIRDIPPNYKLIIKATLITEDSSKTPSISSWAITWQPKDGECRDLFTTDLRIENRGENIHLYMDKVYLTPSMYDWPLLCQNPANTRSTDSEGPGKGEGKLRWFTSIHKLGELGGEYINPVAKGSTLYIVSKDGKKIYAFDAHEGGNETIIIDREKDKAVIPDMQVTSTPAVDDNYLIVATGSTAPGGGVRNKIYAFDRFSLRRGPVWVFEYDSSICYSSAPVISDGKLYITSWSGDSSKWGVFDFSGEGNKLLCIDVDTGKLLWEYNLPAGSVSTPAVAEGKVVVCCERSLTGGTIFVLDAESGEEVWSENIGPIGHTAPVIMDGRIYVVTKTFVPPNMASVQLIALKLHERDNILWSFKLGSPPYDKVQYNKAGSIIPAAYNGRIYIVSPDGILYAINANNGEEIWYQKLYEKKIFSQPFTTSPSYAGGRIYVGTPNGKLLGVDAATGEIVLNVTTIENTPIISSPIIVDGLVIFCDSGGALYCVGELKTPSETFTGYIISHPIYLPYGCVWKKFYAKTVGDGEITFAILDRWDRPLLTGVKDGSSLKHIENKGIIKLKAAFTVNSTSVAALDEWRVTYGWEEETNETHFFEDSFKSSGKPPICTIDVQNTRVGLQPSTARYRFTYTNTTGEHTTNWIQAECTGYNGTKNRETITANLSKPNLTNITEYLEIQFSIKDTTGNETYSQWHNITWIEDKTKPVFYIDTFSPHSTSNPTPICRIEAQDKGTKGNISGINVYSARYMIEYMDNTNVTHTSEWFPAECTGRNGTTSRVTITADTSKLSFKDSIRSTNKIRFYIEDMAGNSNTSKWFEIYMDATKPTSYINNTDRIPSKTNQSPVHITAYATDEGVDASGVERVELYYRKTGESSWSKFQVDYTSPYEWDFTVGRDDGGEYELCTIAVDKAGNIEDFPSSGDVTFIFDPNPPYKPVFKSEYRFTEEAIPSFSDVKFEDDYKLDKIEYRLNFEGIHEWKTIASGINSKTITPNWNLTEEEWHQMREDEVYYIYFKVIDTLG